MIKKPQNIVIIGGGHGAVASAGHNSLLGHNVTVINRSNENVDELAQAGAVNLMYPLKQLDAIFRPEALHLDRRKFIGTPINGSIFSELGIEDLVSNTAPLKGVYGLDEPEHRDSIAEAIEESDLIRIILPSVGHKWAARKIAPYLSNGRKKRIVLEPERTFGVVEFYNELRNLEKQEDISINWDQLLLGGTDTFVFASRRRGTSPQAYILGSKNRMKVATIPSNKTDELGQYLKENMFPQITDAENVLYTSFGNVGAIFHPVLTLLWVSVIGLLKGMEEQEFRNLSFKMKVQHYSDVTPEMGRIMEGADNERLKVAEAYGIEVKSARKWLESAYGSTGPDLATALNNCKEYLGLEIPDSVNHRYIWEDARTSALPIAELGELAGISTPRLWGTVHMCSDMFENVEFYKDGRTLKNMGLEGMNIDQIVDLAINGKNYEIDN